ncbi:hypothetical protein [Gordonia sp. CPCC 205333]|uniref:hypothetical protein n=1 Tax=Gordonia sp. CPCC 205333 TaxID=3140790 RepID=UPI003AF33D20
MRAKSSGAILVLATACALVITTSGVAAAEGSAATFRHLAAGQPAIGDPCSGAEIGRRTTDAAGRAIICYKYRWSLDVGQRANLPT